MKKPMKYFLLLSTAWANFSYANDYNPSVESSSSCKPQRYHFGGESKTVSGINKQTGNCFTDTPPGLSGKDLADFNHLSEGADIFPYEWWVSLKSFNFKDNLDKATLPYSEDMDKRFGFLKARDQQRMSVRMVKGSPVKVKYLIPYVGISASWSTQISDERVVEEKGDVSHSADAFASYEKIDSTTGEKKMITETQIVKSITGIDGVKYKSIRMVGTNCALCHSSALTYPTKNRLDTEFRIQGAPAMVNLKAFFKDMIGSTIVMFVKGDNLKDFLADIKDRNPELTHIKPKEDAEEIKSFFCRNIAKESQQIGQMASFSPKVKEHIDNIASRLVGQEKICFISMALTLYKGSKGETHRLFSTRKTLTETYTMLLNKTYGFKQGDNIGHLKQRMEFLAYLSSGNNPTIDETLAAFNRTDAFGRISNVALRTDFPVNLTAPVSLPWIWGLKYMANLHYNGNSNSVILRNVGQSLGLGAVVTSPELDSTVNVHNLDKLENLVHKIKVPEWKNVFSRVLDTSKDDTYLSEFEIDMRQSELTKGFELYKTNCQSCHESNKLVGPAGVLREYRMFPLYSKGDAESDSPNTDPLAAINAVVPVSVRNSSGQVVAIPFETKIFNDVSGIKGKYYKNYGISNAEIEKMEFQPLRGLEFFRDTLLGSQENKRGNDYGKMAVGAGYKARHLSGVWATPPYLHNGSVPNMMLLLTHESQRPAYFNVRSNRYDPKNLGFQDWARKDAKGKDIPCNMENKTDEMNCFDTTLRSKTGASMGNSNAGHNWGYKLTYEEKLQLINFLKYLPPEPEYSWESQDNYLLNQDNYSSNKENY